MRVFLLVMTISAMSFADTPTSLVQVTANTKLNFNNNQLMHLQNDQKRETVNMCLNEIVSHAYDYYNGFQRKVPGVINQSPIADTKLTEALKTFKTKNYQPKINVHLDGRVMRLTFDLYQKRGTQEVLMGSTNLHSFVIDSSGDISFTVCLAKHNMNNMYRLDNYSEQVLKKIKDGPNGLLLDPRLNTTTPAATVPEAQAEESNQ